MTPATIATVALVLASVALAVTALLAALVVRLMRQSGRTAGTLRRHRIAHHDVHGTPDPANPRERPRRGAVRYEAPTGMQPALHPVDDDPATAPAAAQRPRPHRSEP